MSRRGFTLIEVMIAASVLAAIGAITFGMFKQQYDQKVQVESEDDRYAEIRSAMDRMAKEISEAFLSEHYDKKRFRERPTLFRGRDRGRQDELIFAGLVNERFDPDIKQSDQATVTFLVDHDPSVQGQEDIFRRVNPIIDDESDRKGKKTVLCTNIKGLDIQYWDTLKKDWVDEWDASRAEHQGVLPERVKFTVIAVDLEGKERKYTTQTQIMLQRSLDF